MAMKKLLCFALLFAGYAQAGELLPMSGEECEELQEALIDQLKPVVDVMVADIKVEPILEEVDISGRTKRILLGPAAGGSNITLRVRIIDASKVTETVISSETGAWKGTFHWGQDYDMIDRVVAEAIAFVQSYIGIPIETPQHSAGDDGTDGLAAPAAVPPGH
jgi:hypothetical protein